MLCNTISLSSYGDALHEASMSEYLLLWGNTSWEGKDSRFSI
jgi:hypothetical protein